MPKSAKQAVIEMWNKIYQPEYVCIVQNFLRVYATVWWLKWEKNTTI